MSKTSLCQLRFLHGSDNDAAVVSAHTYLSVASCQDPLLGAVVSG